MVADCGSCFVKYLLCIFNFIIFLSAALILGTGIWIIADKNSFLTLGKLMPNANVGDWIQSQSVDQGAYFLIAIGGFMFIISFLGYCGALKESQCMLITYAILLVIIFFLEVAVITLTVIYKSKAEMYTKSTLKTSLAANYYNTRHPSINSTHGLEAGATAWDIIQWKLHCCGVDNYVDYKDVPHFQDPDRIIPESCCVMDQKLYEEKGQIRPMSPTCVRSPSDANSFYKIGCYDEILMYLRSRMMLMFFIIGVILIVEILGILFAFCLAKSINSYVK